MVLGGFVSWFRVGMGYRSVWLVLGLLVVVGRRLGCDRSCGC